MGPKSAASSGRAAARMRRPRCASSNSGATAARSVASQRVVLVRIGGTLRAAHRLGGPQEVAHEVGDGAPGRDVHRGTRLVTQRLDPGEGVGRAHLLVEQLAQVGEVPAAAQVGVQRTTTVQTQSHHQRASIGRVRGRLERVPQRAQERLVVGHAVDRRVDVLPAHDVTGDEARAWPRGGVHVDHVAASRPDLAGVPALGDAAVDGDRIGLQHDARPVDVPEGPVVHPAAAQVVHRARGVVAVTRAISDVGVQQPDGERDSGATRHLGGQVRRHRGTVEAAPVHAGDLAPFAQHRHRLSGGRAEPVDRWRKVEARRPRSTVQRVVVAVDDVTWDAVARQLGEPVSESRLAEQRGAAVLEDVAGDDHEVHRLVDRGAHHVAPRVRCGGPQRGRHVRRGLGAQALERAVEMQVAGVKEAERLDGRHRAQG